MYLNSVGKNGIKYCKDDIRIPLPINLYPFCDFENMEEKILQKNWMTVKIMKTFVLRNINMKLLINISNLIEIFKFSKFNPESNEISGSFSFGILREIKIFYKIKVFLKKDPINFLKILMGISFPKNHFLKYEMEYLYFVLKTIYENIFGIFVWRDNERII